MLVTPALAIAWLDYLTCALDAHLPYAGLANLIKWAQDSLASMEAEDLIDKEHERYALLLAALGNADRRLEMLSRVSAFSGTLAVHACTHTHQRRDTAIFYNSVEALQCFQCGGWQHIRSVIQ